jgi:polar amino acid transport system substrate-binding protein
MSIRTKTLGLGAALATLGLALGLATTATGTSGAQSLAGCPKSSLALKTPGRLTLATPNPARRPWFGGRPGRGWMRSNPYSAQGYESAVAYAVAKRLGFSWRHVDWQPVDAAQAVQRGPKTFDFFLGQVTYGPGRAQNVDFSSPYFVIPQALLSRRGYDLVRVKRLVEVRVAWLGVQVDTPGERYTVRYVKPRVGPVAYDNYDLALPALERGRPITGIVTDLPTAYVLRGRVTGGIVVGQFPRKTRSDHFALVFEQGSKLRACVNKALGQLRENGTLRKLQARWLGPAGGMRVIR